MPIKAKITEEEVDQMIADYHGGRLLLKDLVKKYGRKATTIRSKFKERGVKIEYNRNRKIDDETKTRIIKLYRQGASIQQVASKTGVSHGAVGNILKQNDETRKGVLSEWSQEDREQLKRLLEDRTRPIAEIAQKLNRSYDSIIDKICKEYPELKRSHQAMGIRCTFNGVQYRSIAEAEVAKILHSNFIAFEYERPVCADRKWTCDFYLPDYDLWIEYDGMGDARTHNGKTSFCDKLSYYKSNGYNYKVITRDDKDILETLGLKINHQYDFSMCEISKQTADEFLSRVHYLKTASKADKYRLGFFYGDQLCGVITFGAVANPKEQHISLNRCATIDRVRLPHPNNNVTSWMVSRSLRWLKKTGYRGVVVSWHDPRRHSGTLYRACNFNLVDNKMGFDYAYIDVDGNEFHKSKCRVPAGQSESEKAKSLGLTKIKIPPKQRWEYEIR